VPFAPQQHREAVMILSGMMLTWLQNQRAREPQVGTANRDARPKGVDRW